MPGRGQTGKHFWVFLFSALTLFHEVALRRSRAHTAAALRHFLQHPTPQWSLPGRATQRTTRSRHSSVPLGLWKSPFLLNAFISICHVAFLFVSARNNRIFLVFLGQLTKQRGFPGRAGLWCCGDNHNAEELSSKALTEKGDLFWLCPTKKKKSH